MERVEGTEVEHINVVLHRHLEAKEERCFVFFSPLGGSGDTLSSHQAKKILNGGWGGVGKRKRERDETLQNNPPDVSQKLDWDTLPLLNQVRHSNSKAWLSMCFTLSLRLRNV